MVKIIRWSQIVEQLTATEFKLSDGSTLIVEPVECNQLAEAGDDPKFRIVKIPSDINGGIQYRFAGIIPDGR